MSNDLGTWVIEVRGPRGVKQVEVKDEEIKTCYSDFRLDRFPGTTEYQVAMYLGYMKLYSETAGVKGL